MRSSLSSGIAARSPLDGVPLSDGTHGTSERHGMRSAGSRSSACPVGLQYDTRPCETGGRLRDHGAGMRSPGWLAWVSSSRRVAGCRALPVSDRTRLISSSSCATADTGSLHSQALRARRHGDRRPPRRRAPHQAAAATGVPLGCGSASAGSRATPPHRCRSPVERVSRSVDARLDLEVTPLLATAQPDRRAAVAGERHAAVDWHLRRARRSSPLTTPQ